MKQAVSKSKAKVKKATAMAHQAVESVEGIDYKDLGKKALKVVIPLVVLKMIHSKYKQATKKTSHWEDAIESLYKEVKAKIKKM